MSLHQGAIIMRTSLNSPLSRRRLLSLGAATATAAILAACGSSSSSGANGGATTAPATSAPAGTAAPVALAAAAMTTGTTTGAVGATSAPAARTGPTAPDLRLGYQPPYIGVAVMQQQKLLDDAFKGEKINIAYQRLLSPTPIYEALAGGSLDFGMGGPPIAALANGQPFQILAVIERSPKTHALLVSPDSPIKTVADLKGKKIGSALGKAYAFPIRALQKAGLTDTDVQWLTIENNEGRSALLSGGLDAWATWDPFYASVEADKQVRKLVDGDPWYPNFVTLFTRADYASKYPDTVIRFMRAYNRALAYVRDNHADAVSIFAKENMLKPEVAQLTVSRRNYQFAAPGDDFLADVTDQGKLFARLGVTKSEPDWTKAINTTLAVAALSGA